MFNLICEHVCKNLHLEQVIPVRVALPRVAGATAERLGRS